MNTFKPRLDILPAAQRQLWPELRPVQQQGYVGLREKFEKATGG